MPVLAYWDIRGLAGPIRFLLAYCKEEFEDKRFVVGDGPEYSRECWFSVKHKLGLPFANLPYYIDGEIKICQSNAICRYIARKHNLCGATEEKRVEVDILENQLMDFRNGFVRLCYGPNFDENKKTYLEKTLPTSLGAFSDFLKDRKFFAGDEVTFVDFIAYELFDQHMAMNADSFTDFKNLKDFHARIRALPEIDAYYKSDKFGNKCPINNKMANFK